MRRPQPNAGPAGLLSAYPTRPSKRNSMVPFCTWARGHEGVLVPARRLRLLHVRAADMSRPQPNAGPAGRRAAYATRPSKRNSMSALCTWALGGFGAGAQAAPASRPRSGHEPAPTECRPCGPPCGLRHPAEQKELHECLLHVHSVFCFVPDDGLGAVDHVGFHLFAAVGGQAVHEQGIRAGPLHHVGVHAPVGEGGATGLVLGLVAHAGPDIGGHQVGVAAGFQRVAEHFEAVAAADAGHALIDLIAVGRADMHLEVKQLGRLQPGVGHVVAVAHPGHGLALDRATVLDVGEDVGQDLAGMEFVGQAVDDGHARVLGETLDLVLAIGADHHQVDHAADHLGTVFDGFGAAQLAVAGGQVNHRATQLVHAGFEAHPCAGAGLLEDHGQRAVGQRVVFLVGLELLLDDGGALQQVRVFVGAQILELQVVAQGVGAHWAPPARKAFTSGARMGTMWITLSAVTLSSRPASAAWPVSAPQGRSSSTPIIRPWPRMSLTPGRLPSSRTRAARRWAPTRAALSSRPSSSMMRMVSTPARMASGLPPKVVPWLPGWKMAAALGPATTAPIGTPEPRPLARGITSGTMPAHWWANHLPVRPMPHCTSSIIISQSRSVHRARSCCRYSICIGLMPPSPWMVSKNTATTFGLPSVAFLSASMSFTGTRRKPSTRGPKPCWIFWLPVADRVAIERPWKAFS